MKTDKLVPYREGAYPTIAGGDARFLTRELRKVENAVGSIEAIMKSMEAEGTVASKAGAVSAADVDDGSWKIIHDTTNNTVGVYANLGGTLFKVMMT